MGSKFDRNNLQFVKKGAKVKGRLTSLPSPVDLWKTPSGSREKECVPSRKEKEYIGRNYKPPNSEVRSKKRGGGQSFEKDTQMFRGEILTMEGQGTRWQGKRSTRVAKNSQKGPPARTLFDEIGQ